jgi:hypothetical protein
MTGSVTATLTEERTGIPLCCVYMKLTEVTDMFFSIVTTYNRFSYMRVSLLKGSL